MKPGSRAASTNVDVVNFGCRLNAFEADIIHARAMEAGLGELGEKVVVVNSCAVTGEAVRQAGQTIRKAKRANPRAKIIVTGCAAQTEPGHFSAMDEVDLVLGNEEKLHAWAYRALPEMGANFPGKVRVEDIMAVRNADIPLVARRSGKARAFVQVQNGCDHRCTFCIIPFGRGNSRSVPVEKIIEQCRALADAGYREIVLTGVDTTSWGNDLEGRPRLGQLVERVLGAVPQLPRLRLSSIDSVEVDAQLKEIIGSERRFMPHLHLSLQHGDNLILKRMKRRHSREEAISFCQEIRAMRPEITLGGDLIAGFPTESEEMFENTVRLVGECGLTWLHVFPYSARPQTPAARMPQLPPQVIRARARRLREVGEECRHAHLAGLEGKRMRVLLEKGGRGHAEDFTLVAVEGGAGGEIVDVVIEGHDGRAAFGQPAKKAESRSDLVQEIT